MKKVLALLVMMTAAHCVLAQQLPVTDLVNARTGKTVTLGKACPAGKMTLVCFWGSWCAHGKHQLQTIAQAQPTWGKILNMAIVGIATDEDRTEKLVLPYIQARGWTFANYIDRASALKHALGASALPYILIIDKQGKVAFTHTGYMESGALFGELEKVAGR